MSVMPAIRVVAEGTETLIAMLPPFTSLPAMDAEMVLSFDDGPTTTYKVEKVRFLTSVIGGKGIDACVEIVVSTV